jgi:hypothetical protein
LIFRQHFVPKMTELLKSRAGQQVSFNFEHLDIGVVLLGDEEKNRQRLTVPQQSFTLPG